MPDHDPPGLDALEVARGATEDERQKLGIFFTVCQVAELLGLTKAYIYQLIRENDLPAIHIGRHLRISSIDLRKWLAAHCGNCGPAGGIKGEQSQEK